MTQYNRVTGVSWPVRFTVADGRHFVIFAPRPGLDGAVVHARVEGPEGVVAWELGRYLGEATAASVIGRAIRTWIEQTGEAVALVERGS